MAPTRPARRIGEASSITRSLACIGLVLTVASLAWAHGVDSQPGAAAPGDPQQRWARMLSRLDANGDGRLSSDEFGRAGGPFARHDANRDGVLTLDEIDVIRRPRARTQVQAWLERNDKDGDGRVTLEEARRQRKASPRNRSFASLDTNQDDQLSEQEYVDGYPAERAAALEKRWERLLRGRDRDRDGRLSPAELVPRARARKARAAPPGTQFFKRFDADGDGRLAREEFLGGRALRPQASLADREKAWGQWIDRLDADADGVLTLDEWAKASPAAGRGKGESDRNSLARLDADGDGYVTREEFLERRPAARKP